MRGRDDLTRQRFGFLKVIKEVGKSGNQYVWECLCECGEIVYKSGERLRDKRWTPACGFCLRGKRIGRQPLHGKYGTPIYRAWSGLLDRYGKDGVCPRWHDFTSFYDDVGEKPQGARLNRIDPSRPYGPNNWHWNYKTTRSEKQKEMLHMGE